MAILERATHSSIDAARSLRVRSVLNSVLWLTGITLPVCFCAAYAFREDSAVKLLLICAGLVPLAVASVGFVYFAIRRPEMLQSEDFQLRERALQIVQEKGGVSVVDGSSLSAIMNPSVRQIASRSEVGE